MVRASRAVTRLIPDAFDNGGTRTENVRKRSRRGCRV